VKIAITGGSGFIGRNLVNFFTKLQWPVIQISRSDFAKGTTHLAKLIIGVDSIINLAGAPVVKRWTAAYKNEILSSRIETTNAFVGAIQLTEIALRPSVIISASAIGIYSNENIHDESSVEFGHGFLSEVCSKWESGLEPLNSTNVRTCIVRLGLVLGKDGGSLQKMLPVFKAGFGGKIGSGKQGFSFIHIDDLCRAIEFLLLNEKCRGIYNLVAPEITTNIGFTKAMARTLKRPALFTVPSFALKLIYGEGSETILSGQFVYPKRLLDEGFRFEYPEIAQALSALLRKNKC
jgi:uncharacterized protein (TIGR01777 family)